MTVGILGTNLEEVLAEIAHANSLQSQEKK